ncbi:MAG TPA: hypothetical protein VFX97_03070 [Pyrinomonadaceae bacterium]|nr:hypothetical protein [Pyrinomonadaceae bacterium]
MSLLVKIVFTAALALAFITPSHVQAQADKAKDEAGTRKAFIENLKKLCGHRFAGETQFPPDPNHPLAGKKLFMSLDSCSDRELRIPFVVGEDRSRTWILTLSEKGLLFKHDHRHPDGTPDKITMYGGWAAAGGTAHLQRFPADADTAKLIPEATTNVWTLEILPEKQQFTYYLERNGQPRYRAVFSLKPLPD